MEDKFFYTEILRQLVRIGDALETLARDGKPDEPNLQRPIGEYKTFDWSSIGASVVQSDGDGATHVEHGGFLWMRRSPSNKYAPAIWFSRAAGKDPEGNNLYLKLITFKEIHDAEPVPAKVRAAVKTTQPEKVATAEKVATPPANDKRPGAVIPEPLKYLYRDGKSVDMNSKREVESYDNYLATHNGTAPASREALRAEVLRAGKTGNGANRAAEQQLPPA